MAVSVEQTVATLRARASALRAAWELRRTDLRERLSRSLRTSLPAGVEARLIGSLAWGGFGEHSDIDLVLRGADSSLASRLELQLTRELEVPVEVLRIEELPASFRERVEREGVDCHGA
jgi:predicted nucleotidyltransferase